MRGYITLAVCVCLATGQRLHKLTVPAYLPHLNTRLLVKEKTHLAVTKASEGYEAEQYSKREEPPNPVPPGPSQPWYLWRVGPRQLA